MSEADSEEAAAAMRTTLCVPHFGTREVLQHGDPAFASETSRLYASAESKALESLIHLKANLRRLHGDDFFTAATEGMAGILGADMSFVMKRILIDDAEAAVEMPPFGEHGSCMMAAAFHYRNNDGSKHTSRHSKFAAYGCPCAYMRHDKVFLIPERLGDFITNNPNQLPTPADSYIGLPLFADDKNIGHFGLMWSAESNAQRKLSWAFIELFLSSLEDMILQRLVQGSPFVKHSPSPERQRSVISHDAVAMTQSLRPYAGSLSHELRTPMQGVVGMLDVIYMNVEEARENADTASQRKKLEAVKQNIEVVQDSSRRAIEAADNVVHAYDMDMSLPAAPQLPPDEFDSMSPYPMSAASEKRPEIVVAGSNLPLNRPNKRRWDDAFSRQGSNASNTKLPRVEDTHTAWTLAAEPNQNLVEGVHQAEDVQSCALPDATLDDAPTAEDTALAKAAMHPAKRIIAPGLRHTTMREVFQYVINEGLKMGGRPEMALAQETDFGETIEVRSRGSDGSVKTKTIDWSVDPAIPNTMFIDEKDLSKLVSCVFLNAIKFTDQNGGRVEVRARMSSRGKYMSIKIVDNGPGIPAAFLPNLFKAFSRDDVSITRQSEGLGLGLLVARGLARKLGGDLMCTRAETEGSNHGSEFEIKIPLAGETITRPSSPFVSPVPRHAVPHLETPRTPPSPPPTSNGVISPTDVHVTSCNDIPLSTPSPKSQPLLPNHKARAPSVTITSSPPTPPSGPTNTSSTNNNPSTSTATSQRPKLRKSVTNPAIDRHLATKYPLNLLVAEDNKLNRHLLVNMLRKLGYDNILEAHDGAEAVRQMSLPRAPGREVDMVLMDLWMPLMDGYEATERILKDREGAGRKGKTPTVLAVTADVTDGAQARVAEVGMKGFLSKPYKMHDLQRLIEEFCMHHYREDSTEQGHAALGAEVMETGA